MKKHIRFIILGINICVLVANIALLVSVRATRQAILFSANDGDAAKPTHAVEDPLVLPLHPFGATLPSTMQRGFCGEMLSEDAHSFRENNLIDATFARYWSLPPSNLEEKVMVAQYAECREKEAKHALALLYKGENPYFPDYVPSVNELADAFDAFAEVNSSLYANFVYSHTFRPTNGERLLHLRICLQRPRMRLTRPGICFLRLRARLLSLSIRNGKSIHKGRTM